MAKWDRTFAATAMITAMHLADDSAYARSYLLKTESQDIEENVVDGRCEHIGPRSQRLDAAGVTTKALTVSTREPASDEPRADEMTGAETTGAVAWSLDLPVLNAPRTRQDDQASS